MLSTWPWRSESQAVFWTDRLDHFSSTAKLDPQAVRLPPRPPDPRALLWLDAWPRPPVAWAAPLPSQLWCLKPPLQLHLATAATA